MSKSLGAKINVTDPTKNSDKFGNYISYKVTSQIIRNGILSPSVTVDRRYSDFSWFGDEITREFPGCIIPPLPEKQTVGRFSSEFVESRRRSLERFLRRVAAHPELGSAETLATFLQSDDSSFQKIKEQSSTKKPKLTSSAMAWFEGTVNSLATGKPDVEKSAADTKVEEISQYVSQLEKQMNATLKHSECLVKRNREISQAMFELGQSLTFLGQNEGDALGAGLSDMGTTIDALSTLSAAHAESESIKFLEPMDEYARMINSIKHAIHQRQIKKDIYLSSLADFESKQSAYRKLVGIPGKESQAKAKEQSMTAAKEVYEAAKVEFEKVSERLLFEFDCFKSQRAVEMREIIVDFVSLQIEYSKKSEEEWQTLLPKLQLSTIDASKAGIHSQSIPEYPPPLAPQTQKSSFFHEENYEHTGEF